MTPTSGETGQAECSLDCSWSGVDQTDMSDPAKVWRCDGCGDTGTSDELRASHSRREASTMTGHWWGHFSYGAQQIAWCNVCGADITQWTQGWGTEGLPATARRKIDAHEENHV